MPLKSLTKLGWLARDRQDQPVSASSMLELQACTTTAPLEKKVLGVGRGGAGLRI